MSTPYRSVHAVLALVLALCALLAFTAVAARPAEARWGRPGVCQTVNPHEYRGQIRPVIQAVNAEYQVNPPNAASATIVNAINYYQFKQRINVLNCYVERAVNDDAYAWYLSVVALN